MELASKTIYHNSQLCCTYGKSIEENKINEKTYGLEPVYCIPGTINCCDKVDSKINLKIGKNKSMVEQEKDLIVDEEKLEKTQKTLESTNSVLKNLTDFMESFIIEGSGKPDQDIEYPDKIAQFANDKCKKCYQRGIIGWVYVDKNKKPIQFNKDEPYFIMPKLCKCVYPRLIEVISNQSEK